jgi:SAM-dependent methyltransferase
MGAHAGSEILERNYYPQVERDVSMREPQANNIKDDRDRPEYWSNIVASFDETHYQAIELVASFPPGRALDLPAGAGRLSWLLYRSGFQVTAGDIEPKNFRNPEIPVVKADFDGAFPFENNQFDYAFCIEGPEHAENQYHTFREFARILQPGGKLILSCPNHSNIESRLRMIFYGVLEPVEGHDSRVKRGTSKYDGHISRPPYALLRMALEHAGFHIDKITSEKVKTGQLFFLPIYFLIRLFTLIKGQKGDQKYWLRDSNSYEVLMGGNSLLLMATLEK